MGEVKRLNALFCAGSGFQPSSLINAISFLENDDARDKRPNVHFAALRNELSSWDIYTQLYSANDQVENYQQALVRKSEAVFKNLNDFQKNQIMMSLQYNHVKAQIYMKPEQTDALIEKYKVAPQGIYDFALPKLITTDQILLPQWMTHPENTESDQHIFEVHGRDVSPDSFEPGFLSATSLECLQEAVEEDGDMCVPLGFFAVHMRFIIDPNDRGALRKDWQLQQFKSNKDALKHKNFFSETDCYNIFMQQQSKVTYLDSCEIEEAVQCLAEYEKEFIHGADAKDDQLKTANDAMKYFFRGDPAHYRNITRQRIRACEAHSKMSPS